jgi:hypothetical protein
MHPRKTLLTMTRRCRILIAILAVSLLAATILQNGQSRCLAIASARSVPPTQVRPTDGPGSDTSLTYIAGSSVKVQQIIGDCDWAVKAANGSCKPTASQTISNVNIAANDIGSSFEQQGKLIFLFGDTESNDPAAPWSTSNRPQVDYHQHDPVASTTVTDGEAGLALNFFRAVQPGALPTPFFVEPSFPDGTKVEMGGDDVPHAGIDFNNKTYVLVNTGADFSRGNPHQYSFSVLTTWDGTTNTNAFTALRTISKLPGGHFIITSLHELAPPEAGSSDTMQGILTYGIGDVRQSNVYLSFDFGIASSPAFAGAPQFETGTGTKYFTGLTGGQATWSNNESDAMPVVKDVVDGPTIAHLSVSYSRDLGLWLMTFDGGRSQQADGTPTNGSPATDGVYFTYAPAPWGPWAEPQLIFNATRDHGLGVFMHDQNDNPPGPIGPTAGQNDPNTTRGFVYAPEMIGRFTKVTGNTLSIYYSMSTWNPYTVVEMRSDFNIVVSPDFSLGFDPATVTVSAPSKVPLTLSLNRIGGFTGNVTITPPPAVPAGIKFPNLPAATTGNSLSFKIKLKARVAPGRYPIVFTGKDETGRERNAVVTLVVH